MAKGSVSRLNAPPEYRPPRGKGLCRTPKSIASQLLSGHAAIGPYLKDKIHYAVDDKCWWCGGGKQYEMQGLAPSDFQVVEGHRKGALVETPKGSLGQAAVLVFLKDTRVGCIGTKRKLLEERDVGGAGKLAQAMRGKRAGRVRQMYNLLCLFFLFSFPLFGGLWR